MKRREKIARIALSFLISTVTVLGSAHGHFFGYDGTCSQTQIRNFDNVAALSHRSAGSDLHCVLCQHIAQFVSVVKDNWRAAKIEARPLDNAFRKTLFSYQLWSDCYSRGPPLSCS